MAIRVTNSTKQSHLHYIDAIATTQVLKKYLADLELLRSSIYMNWTFCYVSASN